jgi:hypothetical protein
MKKLSLLLLSLFVLASASAKKFSPSPAFLKGEKEFNVVFDYSNLVFDGDSKEQHYQKKGERWVEEWEGIRRIEFNALFIKNMNDELKKVGVTAGEFPQANYTMIVEVLDCDFGAYAGPVMPFPGKLKCTVKIVKTGTTEVLSSLTLKESQNSLTCVGTPIDFDRMRFAYMEVAEEVGETLVKVLKK